MAMCAISITGGSFNNQSFSLLTVVIVLFGIIVQHTEDGPESTIFRCLRTHGKHSQGLQGA